MLKTMGQFGLQYREQAQGTLGSLVATPSRLSKVIESQGQDVKPKKNSIFLKKGKTVISVENRKFSISWKTKRTAPLNSSREI